ncbi:MAG: hypothetical protein ACRDNW_23985, partial [Trebonia sp.]
ARWAAPLAAAAAVTAVALSLALIKDAPNGSAAPAGPATPTNPAAPAGPGGVPRYFVAISRSGEIVAGDAVTGKTLATFPHPKNTKFGTVTAAADDQTFVVSALTSSNGSSRPGTGLVQNESWYKVQLAPGTADPARVTLLPIAPQPGGPVTALSASGQELAVAENTSWTEIAVKVFSVATGQPLHDWTFTDPDIPPQPKIEDLNGPGYPLSPPDLTWIDGDKTLALDVSNTSSLQGLGPAQTNTVRELNIAGPASGDLLTDSKVVLQVSTKGYSANPLRSCDGPAAAGHEISADGNTVSCTVSSQSDGWTESFLTSPLTAGNTAAQTRVDYQVTHAEAQGVSTPSMVLWTSPTGDAIIGSWNTSAKGTPSGSANEQLHIGVMKDGTFTPLRFPQSVPLDDGNPSRVAF